MKVVSYRGKKKKAQERKEIACARKDETRPNDVTVWHDIICVPLTPPSDLGRLELISISYELEVMIFASY